MFRLQKSHNWLIYAVINPALRERLGRHARGRLIDVGCGEKPYLEMAAPFVDEHVGVDPQQAPPGRGPYVSGTAYALPFDEASFDTWLCTDVLEHLEEPQRALAEAFRVLTPGGHGIVTVPLFWHLHEEPRDFFRYTRHGLRFLAEQAGFEVVEIEPLTGFTATFAQELAYFLNGMRRGRSRLHPARYVLPVISHTVQAIGLAANRVERTEEFTAEYLMVVRKPGPTATQSA